MILHKCLVSLLIVGSTGYRKTQGVAMSTGHFVQSTSDLPNDGSALLLSCQQNYVKPLGKGQYGAVYKVKCPSGSKGKVTTGAVKVMSDTIGFVKKRLQKHHNEKQFSFGDEDDEEINRHALRAFDREVRTQTKAAGLGLAPTVYSSEVFRAKGGQGSKLYYSLKLKTGTIYGRIFMAIASGRPLSKILEQYKESVQTNRKHKQTVLKKLNKVAQAIKKLHSAGLYHGDLSFDNVYLDEPRYFGSTKVTLIDFGKARDSQPSMPAEEIFAIHCRVFFKLTDAVGLSDVDSSAPEYAKCEQLSKGKAVKP